MRSSSLRIYILVLAVVLVALPACKKDTPPAPAPQPSTEEPPPATDETPEPAEAPSAGEWEAAEESTESFLTPEEINRRNLLNTIYFDYDRSEIRPDQRPTLQANASWLRDNPDVRILVEGHCDERGTRQYNMALGDRRAQAAKDYLVSLGIDESRIETISYGEERPAVEGEGEETWARNRRAEFVAVASGATTN